MKSAEMKDQNNSYHPGPPDEVGMLSRNHPGGRKQDGGSDDKLSERPEPFVRRAVQTLRDRFFSDKTGCVHSWPPEQVRSIFPGGPVTSARLLPSEPLAGNVDGNCHRPHQRPPRPIGRRELSHWSVLRS